MTSKLILLDIDGVFVDPHGPQLEALNDHFGTDHKPEDITGYGYPNLSAGEKEWLFENQWHSPTLYDSLEPSEDALWALGGLRKFARVVACSSPLEGHIQSKYRLLTDYFDREDIILATDKSLIPADLAIDDGPPFLEQFEGDYIIFDQPWNRHIDGHRATNWEDVVRLAHQILFTKDVQYASAERVNDATGTW